MQCPQKVTNFFGGTAKWAAPFLFLVDEAYKE